MADYGTGGSYQRATQALTAALQGLAGQDLGAALAGGAAPYLAGLIKDLTKEGPERILAHAMLGALVAQAQTENGLSGALGAATAEAMAGLIAKQLYPNTKIEDLSEEQKQTISALATIAGGFAGALGSGDVSGAVAGMQTGKNSTENNFFEVPGLNNPGNQQEASFGIDMLSKSPEELGKVFEERYKNSAELGDPTFQENYDTVLLTLVGTTGVIAVTKAMAGPVRQILAGCRADPILCMHEAGMLVVEVVNPNPGTITLATGAVGTGKVLVAGTSEKQLEKAYSYTKNLTVPKGSGAVKTTNFADESKLLSHFNKHGAEFGVKTSGEYLQVGKDIMQHGQKVQYLYKGETRTGYVQFMGNSSRGDAKYGFVGTNSEGAITTIHVESGKSFWKMLNGNPADKTIRPVQ